MHCQYNKVAATDTDDSSQLAQLNLMQDLYLVSVMKINFSSLHHKSCGKNTMKMCLLFLETLFSAENPAKKKKNQQQTTSRSESDALTSISSESPVEIKN